MANEYEVNYDDKRFAEVEADKQAAMGEVQNTYGGMIDNADQYYNKQIEAAQDWANTQTQLQNEDTDFTIEKIEQDKAQAHKDYIKEQSGAYVDWQKQSAKHGVNAEQMAAQGMTGTGYSESSQVSMYNTYQNRVATARESYNQAVLNYNNSIKEARLQNSSVLAEIAFEALQTQLKLSLEGFQYKNKLLTDQMNMKMEVDERYYSRYQDVLSQIDKENQFKYKQDRDAVADQQWQATYDESVRQHDQDYQLRKDQLDEEIRQYDQNYELKIKEYEEGIRQFNEEIARLKEKDAQANEMAIKELELKRDSLLEEQRQFDESAKLDREKLELQRAQLSINKGNVAPTTPAVTGKPMTKPKSSTTKANTSTAAMNSGIVKNGQAMTHSVYDQDGTPKKYAVQNDYYKGAKNPDVEEFGHFANGYQPRGISGHGKVSETGDTLTFTAKTLSGQEKTVTTTIWIAEDYTRWYWDDSKNKYLRLGVDKKGNIVVG